MNKLPMTATIGFIIICIGASALDSTQPTIEAISYGTTVAGILIMAVGLVIEYRQAKRIEENRVKRMLERERRRA